MVTDPFLNWTHVESSQLDKEATINAIGTAISAATQGVVDVVCTAGGTIVVSQAVYDANHTFRLTGTPGAGFTLQLPDGERHITVINASGQTATVDTTTGGTTVSALDGNAYTIQSLGTDLVAVSSNATAATYFGRRSEYIPAAAMQPAVTNGCSALTAVEGTAGQPNVHVRDFDPTTAEAAQFQFPFPNRWNKGVITFQVLYTHAGGQTGGLDGVAWGLSAVQIADDAAWDVAFGTQVVVTLDRANSGDVHVTAESGDLTVAGTLADSYMVFFELERVVSNGADDLDIDARLLGIRLFWTEDQVVDD